MANYWPNKLVTQTLLNPFIILRIIYMKMITTHTSSVFRLSVLISIRAVPLPYSFVLCLVLRCADFFPCAIGSKTLTPPRAASNACCVWCPPALQLQDEERRRKQQLEEIRKREAEDRAKQEEERRWREEERARREAEEKVHPSGSPGAESA